MAKRNWLKKNTGYFFLKLFTSFTGNLPLRWINAGGDILGKMGYFLVVPHKKIAVKNLRIAFPHLSQIERKRIVRDFFIFMAQNSLELLYFLKNPQDLDNIQIEGKDYLDKALAKNKGSIALTAHFGNFPLMSLKLAKEGYQVNVIARPMRDEKVGEYIHNLRTKAGVKTIFSYPRKECVNQTIKALRNNEVVMIQMDQNFGTGGVWVKFFGKLAATPVGPVVFAMRTKASVVPMYIVSRGVGRYSIRIFPEVELDYRENKEEMILVNAIKFTKIIETWIKEHPSYWSWNHRRWKSQPSEKIKEERFKIQED